MFQPQFSLDFRQGQDKWSVVLYPSEANSDSQSCCYTDGAHDQPLRMVQKAVSFVTRILGNHEGRIPAGMRICVFPQPKLSGDFYSRFLK